VDLRFGAVCLNDQLDRAMTTLTDDRSDFTTPTATSISRRRKRCRDGCLIDECHRPHANDRELNLAIDLAYPDLPQSRTIPKEFLVFPIKFIQYNLHVLLHLTPPLFHLR